tara:strand:- start:253 stop:609 length:357 start_codon:yes stop_codon:yes gene_type:complete
MANMERLTKRVKLMEEWIAENEDIGGPQGTLETFNFLVNEARRASQMANNSEMRFNQIRQMTFGFIQEQGLEKEWDKYVEEQEKNALQEQQTEEVPVEEEAESGEEVGETSEEEQKEK